MDVAVEPRPCWSAFFTEAGGHFYSWRGWGPGYRETNIGIFNPTAKQWLLHPTNGPTPPGLFHGGCASIGHTLYCFGGEDEPSWYSDLHELNLESFKWAKIHPQNDKSEGPICKGGCGFVAIDSKTLICFGGYGIGSWIQAESTFTRDTGYTDGNGWTNELHLFDIKRGTVPE